MAKYQTQSAYEIPSKIALMKYVFEGASDVDFCMISSNAMRDSQMIGGLTETINPGRGLYRYH